MRGDASSAWITILVIALLISIWVAYQNSQRANRANAERRQKDVELSELRHAHAKALSEKDSEYAKLAERTARLAGMIKGLAKVFEQRKIQFPWLASAIADFHALEVERDARTLETKKHPAIKAANEVREHGRKRRDAELNFRLMRYRVEYYEKLFPWILEYVGDDVPDAEVDLSGTKAEPTDDPAKNWLNDAEYQNLSVAERNQLALDRWRRTKKTNWQIGRDYERFIGYNMKHLDMTWRLPAQSKVFRTWAEMS